MKRNKANVTIQLLEDTNTVNSYKERDRSECSLMKFKNDALNCFYFSDDNCTHEKVKKKICDEVLEEKAIKSSHGISLEYELLILKSNK